MDQTNAYREAVKRADGTYPCTPESARVTASNLERRLRENRALWQDILQAIGLDDYTLGGMLQWALNAKKTEFYQGEAVAEVDDNGTRLRATELLAELLGHRKNALEIAGAIGIKSYVSVSPDDWKAPDPTSETEHG